MANYQLWLRQKCCNITDYIRKKLKKKINFLLVSAADNRYFLRFPYFFLSGSTFLIVSLQCELHLFFIVEKLMFINIYIVCNTVIAIKKINICKHYTLHSNSDPKLNMYPRWPETCKNHFFPVLDMQCIKKEIHNHKVFLRR